MKERVEAALAEVRQTLQADGGGVELVELDGTTVKVKLTGACHGCPAAAYTLANHVEKRIKELVPEVESVVAVQ
jgi:Fe-S cluster biogenesis protein NfuA